MVRGWFAGASQPGGETKRRREGGNTDGVSDAVLDGVPARVATGPGRRAHLRDLSRTAPDTIRRASKRRRALTIAHSMGDATSDAPEIDVWASPVRCLGQPSGWKRAPYAGGHEDQSIVIGDGSLTSWYWPLPDAVVVLRGSWP